MSSGDIHEPATGQEDPWRYGWRYVKRVNGDGVEESEQVPLTLEDVLFPEEGDFRVETLAHIKDCMYLFAVLAERLSHRPDAGVFCDNRIDWGVMGLRALGPDVAVFFHAEDIDPQAGTFYRELYDAVPVVVIEVTSPSTRANDVGPKVDFYHRANVPLYVIADTVSREGQEREMMLRGYRAGEAGYVEFGPDERGRIRLAPLPLWITLRPGRVALEDAAGEEIGDYTEVVRRGRELQDQFDQLHRDHEEVIMARRDEYRLRESAERVAAEEASLRLAEAERRDAAERERDAAESRFAQEARRREKAERDAADAMEQLLQMKAELERLRGTA